MLVIVQYGAGAVLSMAGIISMFVGLMIAGPAASWIIAGHRAAATSIHHWPVLTD